MKKYRDKEGKRIVEVSDLSYLTDRNHHYNWFQRHYHHHRLRRALKKASSIIAADKTVAQDIHRFYFIPNDNIDLKN